MYDKDAERRFKEDSLTQKSFVNHLFFPMNQNMEL